jgi:hypothetical protein
VFAAFVSMIIACQLVGPPSTVRVPRVTPVSGFFQTEPCRLNHQAGVETCLLVSRWSKVVVGENGAERTVFTVVVECVVSKPPLARLSVRI